MGLPGDYKNKRLKPGPSTSALTAEEGFLLSRLGSGLLFQELVALCPWPEEEIQNHLDRLLAKSAIQFVEEATKDGTGSALLQQLQAEDQDPVLGQLDRDFRRQILLKHQSLGNQSPYEILDLPKSASAHAVKVQYLQLSKQFHPDRFFRKNLGHYKEKLDQIFSRIQKAYEILSDPHEREVIDRMQTVAAAQKSKSKDQLLKQIRQIDPQLETKKKAEKFYQEGLELQRQQDFVSAHNAFALASSNAPDRNTYIRAIADIKPLVNKQKGETLLSRAKGALEFKLPKEAFDLSSELLKATPDHPEAQLIWARAVLELKKAEDYKAARERLKTAKAKMPKDPLPCFFLGRILIALDDKKAAKAALEEALKRDPHHTASKKLLEDL